MAAQPDDLAEGMGEVLSSPDWAETQLIRAATLEGLSELEIQELIDQVQRRFLDAYQKQDTWTLEDLTANVSEDARISIRAWAVLYRIFTHPRYLMILDRMLTAILEEAVIPHSQALGSAAWYCRWCHRTGAAEDAIAHMDDCLVRAATTLRTPPQF